MYGIPHQNKGVIGSSSIQIFDLACASTGLNEKMAKQADIQADSVYIIAPDKVGLMANSNPLHFKLIFEIPTVVPVYVHCRSAQRSYNAVMALQNNGYTNVVNISGSFLGICLHEYFNDVTTGRKPIVTAYNFK